MSKQDEKREQSNMQAYLAALFPFQRETIAMAQLAGCEFRPAKFYEPVIGDDGYGSRKTTHIVATLPNGAILGIYGDIYEGAVACLAELNKVNNPELLEQSSENLFRLLPENEPP